MCSVCMQIPCNARCPNAPEPKAIYKCSVCGEGIFRLQKYFETAEGYVCNECIKDMSAEDLMEMIGERMAVADEY